ncbi:hypothetical protein [Limnobaculum parvum]|uniref:Uncharacterized protein n=1 Tax=Limnobaculum parvum TaxID=2172103 RepID=A0A2Y9U043_9GAMM|nr:hypothetical protein [Limnobaculum parvum]AWH89014.1 hypothetical protein HYN51_10865 [Limnobaculum parvum]
MELNKFINDIKTTLPIATVMNNPGGGISTIINYSDTKITYLRGKSKMSISFNDLYETYIYFKGMNVSSSDLRRFKPSVFNSKACPAGHSCNCTFLFLIFEKMNMSTNIGGKGVRGNPFSVTIYKNTEE